MQRDSVSFTFTVAAVLCVVCSLLVSSAAEALKPIQEKNKQLDKNKNVLMAAGLLPDDADATTVKSIFDERIREVLVDLDSGKEMPEAEAPKGYDPRKAAKNASLQEPVEPSDALKGIRFREPYAPVYKITKEGDQNAIEGYILPVYGKGLWSTLYGFLALEADRQTVRGITFYEHAETPGLGGEVDNPKWKAKWHGKTARKDGQVVIEVVKGAASSDPQVAPQQVDGLSGATLTTNGVDALVQYWLGPEGFGPYLTGGADAGKSPQDSAAQEGAGHANQAASPEAELTKVNHG
ncbi:Na(+)-translocating NADH-quinone reductase subunit C [Posidoniimonas polymericola]|uniref:Na(+)-translocating NADH-quinone reductase subunit C n=1 Tax=Posidoniimonas polymericola TaxID=2528002 RepID=A0A5C5XYK5_9BACT|nr:Na(+)-translocating NADH-quinone reductase subunit C [Posidoniimonas polymericola]TWT67609.1 Na(+)-translocating NADH-quinone reductase subunit C [Posidoniimonas polymericola]